MDARTDEDDPTFLMRQDATDVQHVRAGTTAPRSVHGGDVPAAPQTRTRRRPWGAMAVALLLTLAAAGLVAWVVHRPQVGQVVITTSPKGAAVSVNDKPMQEQTPLILRDVPVGVEQVIVFSMPGYKKKTKRVTLATHGQTLKLPIVKMKSER